VGPLFAALIKILPVFLFVLPGLMFYAMVNQGMFSDLSGEMNLETGKATLASLSATGDWEVMKTSEAYTEMIVRLLPSGLTGVIWKQASYRGALATMIGGAFLGVIVFTVNSLNPDGWLATLPGGFMMMAFYLFLACSVILFTVSPLKPKTAGEDPESLYFRSLGECFAFKGWNGLGNYKVLATLVLAIMAVLYFIFR